MYMKQKIIKLTTVVLLLSFLFSLTVSAKTTTSYYYDHASQAHEAPLGYSLGKEFFLTNNVPTKFGKISDIETDAKGNIYLLSSETGDIIVLNSQMEYQKTIIPTLDSENDNCIGAEGLFISEYDDKCNIYIADTMHSRVLKLDENGCQLQNYVRPDTPLIDSAVEFNPIKVVVNEAGSMYVVCRGIYLGAVIMDNNGEFLSFYGSNKITVTASVLYDALWKKIFGSSRKGDLSRYVPIEFSNITMDDRGFVYTVTSSQADDSGIRLLNYGGNNLFDEITYGDLENITSDGKEMASEFTDIIYLGEGILAVLDSYRNRVFVYNNQGDLLTIFGGKGNYEDYFVAPTAIEANQDNIFVYDSEKQRVTMFNLNEYGKNLFSASRMYSQGKYEESEEMWTNILAENNGFQTAYVSIGRVKMSQNDYKGAMEYFKLGNAKSDYSEAFAGQRKQVLQKYFVPIFILVIGLISLVFYLLNPKRLKKRNELTEIPSTLAYSILHPMKAGMRFIKSGTKLSKYLIFFVLPLWFISNIISAQYSGFIFNQLEEHPLDLRVEFIATFVLGATFILANWLIVTIIDGIGTMQEISTVTAMALIPYICGSLLSTFLSNFMLLEEAMIVKTPVFIGLIWAVVILIYDLAKIHDFTIWGAVKNSVLTICGIAILLALLLLEISILKQIQVFFETIMDELIMLISMGG